MKVKNLALYQFRNFTNVAIDIPAKAPWLIAAAPNATGKTNFLESLVVLLRGKSWRADLPQCLQWGKEPSKRLLRSSPTFRLLRFSKSRPDQKKSFLHLKCH